MTDIVERLRRKRTSPMPNGLGLEAAAEIERLRKLLQIVDDNGDEKDKLAAEIERLKAMNGTLSDALTGAQIEVEQLKTG